MFRTGARLQHLEGIELADPRFTDQSHIDMLLSASVYARIVLGTIIKGHENEPIAIDSELGWLITGPVPSERKLSCGTVTSLHICNECHLDETLQKFWVQEEVPVESLYTVEEKQFEDHFNQTVCRDDRGRYVLRLPFKSDYDLKTVDFRSSYYPAERMLVRMENRFQTDIKLKELYHKFIEEYENCKHMSKVLQNTSSSIPRYFIPHHAIWKEKSTSTKLRTVFNGSSKLKTGISLNDMLLIGPNLLPHLIDLLIGWQNYRYVVVADIEKMYRQMLIHEADRKYQSILWRSNPKDPISIYELDTVTYGVASSPCHANMTIKRLAKDHMINHPYGADVLHKEIYMDDVLSGGHTLNEA